MNYVCTLISVKDIEKSKRFYHDVLGLEVLQDLGANVALTGASDNGDVGNVYRPQ